MSRLPRSALPEHGFFHVYSRGVDRSAIVRDDEDCFVWVSLLTRAAIRFDVTCHAYCLMPNHFHLLLEGARERVSACMHRLNGLYAQHFNERHERTGHLFQGRFGMRVIEDEAYLGAACAYIVHNPVRAGLCNSATEWPWGRATIRSPTAG